MAASEKMEIEASDALKRQLEDAAARLNMTVSAYILYLHSRSSAGADQQRFDRHVREIFGKHGQLMRRLAQ